MRSNDTSKPLDLVRGLPTTPEDIAVLHRLRHDPTLQDLGRYFEFLRSFPPPSAAVLRERRVPRGDLPFEL